MKEFNEYFDTAMKFHGHKCPAMPMGLRAGLAAMKVLGVERSEDKELFVEAETGKGHAAGCFLDGIMTATGCTYGKSNIQKLYYNKMAFTLIDAKTGKAVRVSLKPEFFEKAMQFALCSGAEKRRAASGHSRINYGPSRRPGIGAFRSRLPEYQRRVPQGPEERNSKLRHQTLREMRRGGLHRQIKNYSRRTAGLHPLLGIRELGDSPHSSRNMPTLGQGTQGRKGFPDPRRGLFSLRLLLLMVYRLASGCGMVRKET